MNRSARATWRERAQRHIQRVVDQHGTDDLDALDKTIRANYPYKVWLEEVKRTMFTLRNFKGESRPGEQGPLFDGGSSQ